MRFDENLRNLRKEKDYSQEYLAERLGVTRQTISKWENGTAMPDLKKFIELADFFEASMDDLLGLDYKTVNLKQSFSEDACHDYNEAAAIQGNRYTNELIRSAQNRIDSKTKALSIWLVITASVLVITIIFLSGTISSLRADINNLSNSVFNLQQMHTPNSNYYGDDYYDIEINVLNINSDNPYIVQAEFKYAPSSYPKNSKIYYLLPKKDGGVERIEAAGNNGEFVAEVDMDLSLDKSAYFVLDDGENIAKQEIYFDISDVYGNDNNIGITYGITDKPNNEFLFTNIFSEKFEWNNSKYAKLTSADIVVSADSKEVYRQALKKSELQNNAINTYYEMNLPDFYVKDLKNPKEFDIYIEVKLDNGVICKVHTECQLPMNYTDDNTEYQVGYVEYIFADGDKTITTRGKCKL